MFCTQASNLQAVYINITSSVAKNSGGALSLDYNSVGSISFGLFESCWCDAMGGSIYVSFKSILNVEDTIFRDTFATNSGGSVYAFNRSPIQITRSIFVNGSAVNSGGCVYADGISLMLTSNNFSMCSSNAGGAVFLLYTDATSVDNTYRENIGWYSSFKI